MNNPRSMALGWGSLVLAAGVGYIFARKEIDERRRNQAAQGSRPTEKLDWQARINQATEATQSPVSSDGVPGSVSNTSKLSDSSNNP